MNLIKWLKENKLAAGLLLILALLVLKNYLPFSKKSLRKTRVFKGQLAEDRAVPGSIEPVDQPAEKSIREISRPLTREAPPQPEAEDRLVVRTSQVSLLVDNVSQAVDQIVGYAEDQGGYLVSSSLSRPEEAPVATVIVRVPQEKLGPILKHLEGLAVRVVSEKVQGRDVTDQYLDLQARLATLEKTKTKLTELLNQATKIDDLLRVQRELINLQRQIDNIKDREEYLEKTAENARLTVHLAADEWSLPYTPSKPFRPEAVFKRAVRSLILSLRGLARGLIWISVYALIWLPVMLIIHLIKRHQQRKK